MPTRSDTRFENPVSLRAECYQLAIYPAVFPDDNTVSRFIHGSFFVILYRKLKMTAMSTRKQLEEDLKKAKERIDKAPKEVPEQLMEAWKREYDEISFELNNLYDDEVNEFTD